VILLKDSAHLGRLCRKNVKLFETNKLAWESFCSLNRKRCTVILKLIGSAMRQVNDSDFIQEYLEASATPNSANNDATITVPTG
jgi:hypothetical protein